MSSSNNGGYGFSTGHLLSPNRAYSSRTGLYSIELLVKAIPMEIPKPTQAVSKMLGCKLTAGPHWQASIQSGACLQCQRLSSSFQWGAWQQTRP